MLKFSNEKEKRFGLHSFYRFGRLLELCRTQWWQATRLGYLLNFFQLKSDRKLLYYPKTVSLGTGCKTAGKVSHETMHALGFIHEHQREDRDDYIKVNYDNIAFKLGVNQ